jgi:hypothetical protein
MTVKKEIEKEIKKKKRIKREKRVKTWFQCLIYRLKRNTFLFRFVDGVAWKDEINLLSVYCKTSSPKN